VPFTKYRVEAETTETCNLNARHTSMRSFAHFSRHAFERINQRTTLSCEEIAEILDRGLFVNAGRKPGFNRAHLVFYSYRDECCFVAIQDSLSGTVVTILPLDYHKNLAWEIETADCDKAKNMYVHAPAIEKRQTTSEPKIFMIRGHYLDHSGTQKTKVLVKTPCAPYGNNLKEFIRDKCIFENITQLAIAKDIDPDSMFSVSIRLGNDGAPIVIDLRCTTPDVKQRAAPSRLWVENGSDQRCDESCFDRHTN
jgi:hypothetical protein